MKALMFLYSLSDSYIDELKKVESKVMHNKERPYVGPVFQHNGLKWYAPMTSDKNNETLQAGFIWLFMVFDPDTQKRTAHLSLRNMIPVPDREIHLFDFNKKGEDYRSLLSKQHLFIKSEQTRILKKAKTYYEIVVNKQVGEAMLSRSCDFSKLEAACRSISK